MLFLWSLTRRGKIWIDGEGMRAAVARSLPPEYLCQEVSFVGDQSLLNIYVSVPEKDDPKRRLRVSDGIASLFLPMGIVASVHFVPRAPEESPGPSPIHKLPLFWGGVAAGVVALFHLGVRGIVWTILGGLLGFAAAWFALTEDGRKLVRQAAKEFRR
jgi:hypothetical protein